MAFDDGVADFRSDTVTRPTTAMRRAMAEAAVGDDVYGDDPTVNSLQAEVAAALGKEAALFVPSGVMGNQVALAVHTDRGEDVLVPRRAHIRNAETGAGAAWSGVAFRDVGNDRGVITPDDLEGPLAEAGTFTPAVSLLTWENSHYFSGGTVVAVDTMAATAATARAAGLAIHLDGARLWNAVAASGVPGAHYAAAADSVMFCFSKGLGAPVGSILCGGGEFIAAARDVRKRLGGGMRQVGVIAAAAVVAFRDRDRLGEDHLLASLLGEELAGRFPDAIDLDTVQTNMVHLDEAATGHEPGAIPAALAAAGILVGYVTGGVLRFACHRDVDAGDVHRLLAVVDALGQ
jgi:threonine aldolase